MKTINSIIALNPDGFGGLPEGKWARAVAAAQRVGIKYSLNESFGIFVAQLGPYPVQMDGEQEKATLRLQAYHPDEWAIQWKVSGMAYIHDVMDGPEKVDATIASLPVLKKLGFPADAITKMRDFLSYLEN